MAHRLLAFSEDISAFWVAREIAILSQVFEQAIASLGKSNQSGQHQNSRWRKSTRWSAPLICRLPHTCNLNANKQVVAVRCTLYAVHFLLYAYAANESTPSQFSETLNWLDMSGFRIGVLRYIGVTGRCEGLFGIRELAIWSCFGLGIFW